MDRRFQIITHHKPLESKEIRSRLMINFLSQFDFNIKYEPEETNVEADCLSSNSVLEKMKNSEECISTVNLITLDEIKNDQNTNQLERKKIKNLIKIQDISYKEKRKKRK